MDEARWAQAFDELGIELPLASLRAIAPEIGGDYFMKELLPLVYAAVDGELGYAHAYMFGATALVVVDGMRLVIGIHEPANARQPFPRSWGFMRWSKAVPLKNRQMVEAWSRERHPNTVVGTLVRRPALARGDDAALRAAIVADPDDEGARTVYADWLIERGDVRGEIMRLRQAGKLDEARILLRQHRRTIAEPVAPFVRSIHADGGLIEGIEIMADQLAKHAGKLFPAHPIHRLHLAATKATPLAKIVPVAPLLAGVRDVELEGRIARNTLGGFTPIAPSVLAPTAMFANARALRLSGIGDALGEWERFFAMLAAPQLVALSLGALPSREILEHAAAALPRVSALRLSHQPWLHPGDDLGSIADALASRALSVLSISSWQVDLIPLLRALARSTIVDLELADCPLDDRALRELAKGRFHRLGLAGAFSASALLDLIASQPLRALSLRLQGMSPAEVELVVLALSTAPPTLAELTWYGPLADDQLARLALSRRLLHRRH